MFPRLCFAFFAVTVVAMLTSVAPATAQIGESPAAEGHPKTSAPRLLRRVEPEFTQEALDAGVTGRVFVSLVVRADGSAEELKVVRGLGYGLDEKAIACIKQWEFKPGTKDGTPIDVHVTVELPFIRP